MIDLLSPIIPNTAARYIGECLESGWVSYSGNFVSKLEEKICEYTKIKHAVACSSGTCGLSLALKVLGIGKDDEVVVPTVTFIATANAVKHVGAEPSFIDCDEFYNIDVGKLLKFLEFHCQKTNLGLQNKRTGRIVKAIIPVHVFGNPCNMGYIKQLAESRKLFVIEDAAESLGSWWTHGCEQGLHTGSVGDIGVFSFSFNKLITSGNGGMIVTNNEELAKKAKYLSLQAKDDALNYIHNDVGYQYGLSNINAALAYSQMESIELLLEKKKFIHHFYKDNLAGLDDVRLLEPDFGIGSNHWLNSIKVDNNQKYIKHLALKGIVSRPLWYPCHLQIPYMRNSAFDMERSEIAYRKILSIPSGVSLTEKELFEVVNAIRSV